MYFNKASKAITRQEIWRAIRTPNFEQFETLDEAKREFEQWHKTQKWPSNELLDAAMQATSRKQLVTMATNSLAKGLRYRLGGS